jgi:putative transposase
MREIGLSPHRPRHHRITTHSDPSAQVAANLLDRNFTASRPNEKWAADVRHVGTYEIPAQAGEGESNTPLGRGLT